MSLHSNTEFIKLLTSHQNVLRGLVAAMTANHQEIDDLQQEINVTLWEKADSFTIGTDFKAWASSIARNKVKQFWAKQKKLGRFSLSPDFLDHVAELKAEATPSHSNQKLHALSRCLEKLAPKEKELIHLRYSSKSNIQQFSSTLNRSPESVRVTLHRIRQKLKSCISHNLVRGGNQ